MPKDVEKKYRQQSYRHEWEKESWAQEWLSVSKDHPGKAYCSFCEKHLVPGKSELIGHTRTALHLRAKTRLENRPITSSAVTNNSAAVKDKQGSTTMAQLEDEYSWQPPSESELKVIEARRDRNNKISSIMGQYLLKGYKMLAVTCSVCDCVLLEDRLKNKYCIGCLEVDADTKKDNPAVSEEAARRTVQEIQHRQNSEEQAHSSAMPPPSAPSCQVPVTTQCAATSTSTTVTCQKQCAKKTLTVHGTDLSENAGEAVVALRDKLAWATEQLSATSSIHEAQNLAGLITETCKAITALKEL